MGAWGIGWNGRLDSRHDTRHTDQTVDTSETDADPPQSRPPYDPLTRAHIARRETEHGTRPIGLTIMNVPVGMRSESGKVDVESQSIEVEGDQVGSGALTVHPDGQGLQASKEEETILRRQARPGRVDEESYTFSDVVAFDGDDPGHDVVMPREVLGPRIVDDIRTEVERSLKVGGHHGVVDHDKGFRGSRMDQAGDHPQVGDLEKRVGRGFDEDHLAPLPHVLEDRLEVVPNVQI